MTHHTSWETAAGWGWLEMAGVEAGPELTGFGSEVDTEGSDPILCRVPVELADKEVVVLHAQGELLHVWNGQRVGLVVGA